MPNSTATLERPHTIKAAKGQCCLCNNDAVYYDSQGTGYCLSHWQGSAALTPGTQCAELMKRDGDSYWVRGTEIVEAPEKAKRKRYGAVWTFRKTNHKPVQTDAKRLLPIRPGMPQVKLWEFGEVFELANFSAVLKRSERLAIDLEALAEDKAEAAELDAQNPPEAN